MTARRSVSLESDPLSPGQVMAHVQDDRAGAIDVFVGTTRRYTEGRETVELTYEAYETMAVAEMDRLADEACARWPLTGVAIHHRVGTVPVGEISVVIAVSSPHRAAALDACRFLIEGLKADVPIWKRERYADGSIEWVRPLG